MLHQVVLWRDLNQGWCTLYALHCTSSLLVPPLLPGPVMSCWVRAVPLLLHISIYTTPAFAGCQLQYKMTLVTLQALALSGFPDTQKSPVVKTAARSEGGQIRCLINTCPVSAPRDLRIYAPSISLSRDKSPVSEVSLSHK